MVELTKDKRYTKELVRGMLEDRALLPFVIGSELGSDIIPILDLDIAVKRIRLTPPEQFMFNYRFNAKHVCMLTTEQIARELGFSEQYVRRITSRIVNKVHREINRGLGDV